MEKLSRAMFSSHITPVAAVFLLGLVYILATTLHQYRRLRHIPGPPYAGLSKWWLARNELSGEMNLRLLGVSEKYGSIARIGPNLLLTSDPDLLKRMLAVRTKYKRGDWYDAAQFDPGHQNIISERDDAAHNKLRGKMAAGYSGKDVEGLELRVDRNVRGLIKLLDEKYVAKGKRFEFARKVQYFTLDAISDISFDEPFGFLTADSDLWQYIYTAESALTAVLFCTIWPWLTKIAASFPFNRLLPSDDDPFGFGKIKGIARKQASERYGPNKKVNNDMLGSFVNHGLTPKEAESEIIVQTLAGSDTTATAIRATMLHVVTNPRVLAAFHAELDARGITGRAPDAIISEAEARTLPYLQAIIKEGLRIWPPVTGLSNKVVPPEGDTFNGIHLPGGTNIGYCAWGVFRRRDIWGDDAAEFRPERWLETEPEKLKKMEATLELIFSYGRWQCLGRNIALMETNKVIVELLRRFDLILVDPTKPWVTKNISIHAQSGLWMRGYKRV
ncbi:cytochrome P450 monooxygenase mpaDE [Cladorrhinum samala]|uniref:Cytochrome P450 monooxygenase mpaDE n=1 Tax=Cladorrhinum samala TaxID=585594 RepID=A0AAV9HV62_9PEZI|nr:cytochrome P450 monooxygenase mpaDE [Cladorrhinum samala]